jgi:hypothetical protein
MRGPTGRQLHGRFRCGSNLWRAQSTGDTNEPPNELPTRSAQGKELRTVSLYTIVSDGLAGRLPSRPVTADAVAQPPTTGMAGRLTGASMRVLETGLALIAIVTALLIGLGR